MKTDRILIRINENLKKRILKFKKEKHVNFSDFVRSIIDEELKKQGY